MLTITEDSYTHRHLCEFVGLDADMTIKEPYPEMFDHLNEIRKKELDAVNRQYPF
ncbi:putative aspartate--tRNA ligase [Dioscorea sansibarensis]